MRKIYTLLTIAILSLCSFVAKADDVTFTLNVNGDTDAITATVNGSAYELVAGENSITAPMYASIYITANDGYYLTLINDTYGYTYAEGSYVSLYAYGDYSYTLNISKIEYDAKVKITVDDASKVAVRTNNTYRTLELQDGENIVEFSSEIEQYLNIASTSSTPIYKVTMNGETLEARYNTYYIYPSGAELDEVVITTEYPDVKVPITFSFVNGEEAGDYNCLTSVKVDGENIDLTALEGLEVQIGSNIAVTPNTSDYKIEKFTVNGNEQYIYNGFTYSATVTSDEGLAFVIDAHKYSTISIAIDVEDASTITAYKGYSYQGVTIDLHDGYNEIELSEQTTSIQIEATSGNVLYSIVDENGTDYTSSWSISVHDGMVLTVKAGAIVRDQVLTVNAHDLDQAPASFGFYYDLYSSRTKVDLVEGENQIEFYSGDNPFGLLYFDGEAGSAYLDNAPLNTSYGSCSFSASNGSVVELFFDKTKDNSKSVTFEIADGIQSYWASLYAGTTSNYISNWQEGVNVLPGCKLFIEVSEYYFANPYITVNDEAISANEDGFYEFTVNDDCKVSITQSSAVSSIIADSNVSNNVYNLQGISVLRNASADQISALPAGLYIINGKKVIKK